MNWMNDSLTVYTCHQLTQGSPPGSLNAWREVNNFLQLHNALWIHHCLFPHCSFSHPSPLFNLSNGKPKLLSVLSVVHLIVHNRYETMPKSQWKKSLPSPRYLHWNLRKSLVSEKSSKNTPRPIPSKCLLHVQYLVDFTWCLLCCPGRHWQALQFSTHLRKWTGKHASSPWTRRKRLQQPSGRSSSHLISTWAEHSKQSSWQLIPVDWKACKQSMDEEKATAAAFRKKFKPFDFNLSWTLKTVKLTARTSWYSQWLHVREG